MPNRLKEIRQARDYSRFQFAKLLEVAPATVWRWEQNTEGMTVGTLKRCAEVLEVAATAIDPELNLAPTHVSEEPIHA